MYQIIVVFILILLAWSVVHNFMGWTGKVVSMPAYNISLVRQNLRKRNCVLIKGFLTEESKQEYDELYNYLQEEYDENTDVIMNDTTLTQLEDCISNIPVLFYTNYLWPIKTSYSRILNTKKKLTETKRSVSAFCCMQPMTILIQKPDHSIKKIQMTTGDALFLPNHTKYGFDKGTIDYFSYFK